MRSSTASTRADSSSSCASSSAAKSSQRNSQVLGRQCGILGGELAERDVVFRVVLGVVLVGQELVPCELV